MKNKTIIVVMLLFSGVLNAEKLALKDYLDQVTGGNQNYTAAQKGLEAGQAKSEEGDLALAYSFFTTFQYSNDKRESNLSFITCDRTTSDTLSFGFKKLTSFGLSGSLHYDMNYTYMHGGNVTILNGDRFYTTSPVLDLRQSLWQNAFGRQTRAIIEATDAKNLSGSYASSFTSKKLLAETEALYWSVSIVRDLIKIKQDNLERAEKIKNWAKRRAGLNLADNVDLLQADANYKLAQMELAQATEDEKDLVRRFNTARGINSDEMTSDLEQLTVDTVVNMPLPERKGERDDVISLKEAARAAAANAKLSRDRNFPTLDLFTTLSLNGRDPMFDASFKESWRGNYPYAVVGVTFSAPLDFMSIHRVNSGYDLDKLSAEDSYERKRFEVDREWNSLNKKVNEMRSRLKIAKEVEDAQYKKYTYEQNRHKMGRTTTYQVIAFQQDYATAQFNRLKLQEEILALISTMKTFQGQEG